MSKNSDVGESGITAQAAWRTLAALLIASTLLGVTGCSDGSETTSGDVSAAQRPCGQATPCPPIKLEKPGPWPEGDPAGAISLSQIWRTPPGYQLEEYFISGHANVFNYNDAEVELGESPGDNLVVRYADKGYKTRILVAYPSQKERFNGVVIIEMLASNPGYDNSAVLPSSGEYLRREGIAYIGVTTSGDQSVAYLKAGCGKSLPECGARYADLSLDDNGLEFEIISQLASALKSWTVDQSPFPADYNPVELVFVTGFAQQSASVITLASQFHQDAIDGYFPQGYAWSRPISGKYNGPRGVKGDSQFCGQPDSAPYPDCIGSLAEGEPQLRTNLPVPIYQGMTENDAVYSGGFANRQPDVDVSPYASYRLLEVPGTGHHASTFDTLEVTPGYRVGDLCVYQPAYRDMPVSAVDAYNAYWQAMIRQVREGKIPANAPRIVTDDAGEIIRDPQGNAVGGLRLPEFEFARASFFSPNNVIKPSCTNGSTADCLPITSAERNQLAHYCFYVGSTVPFTSEVIAQLYPDYDRYVGEYSEYTQQLVNEGFLLEEDAQVRLRKLLGESP